MRSRVVFWASLTLAWSALAVEVTSRQASVAAVAWAGSGSALGTRLGTAATAVTSHMVVNGFGFYAVRLQDGGTVFMSSDTAFDPVLAFTDDPDPDLSVGSPLHALLTGDIAYRAQFVTASGASPSAKTMLAAPAANPSAEALWARLLAAEKPVDSKLSATASTTAAAEPVTSVDDVRVAPLLTTKWSQGSVGTRRCYNYYTPEGAPCGCTATALAQIMRYHRYPQTELEKRTFACMVQSGSRSVATNMTTIAGIYDWEQMVESPGAATAVGSLEAIGRLTYDVGVSLRSEYAPDGTGADPKGAAPALRDYFGYREAYCFFSESNWNKGSGGLHNLSTRMKVIYANLDAKLPVQLGIYGYDRPTGTQWGGHAVVADGYGFKTIDEVATPFVHLNLGWSGKDDLWYNLPEIHTGTGVVAGGSPYDFDYLGAATFNIMTESAGEILAGRVLDVDRLPVAGAVVTALDGETVAGTAVTDAKGIYALVLPGARSYRLVASSADGRKVVEAEAPVALGTTVASAAYIVANESSVGNRWGNDIVMAPPTVRLGDHEYATLDLALLAAGEQGGTPVVEVFAPTELKHAVTNDFSYVLVTQAADPSTMTIACAPGAELVAAAGATLTVSNVVFESEQETHLAALAGGKVRLGGVVGVARVVTAAADALEVFAPLASAGIVVDCAVARATDQQFGMVVGDYAAVAATVSQLLNPDDDDLCGQAREGDGAIVWFRGECDPAVAEASVEIDGVTSHYRRLEAVLTDLGDRSAKITVLKDCALQRPLAVNSNLELVSPLGKTIAMGSEAGLTVTGGMLTVSGLVFADYVGAGLFVVDGGKLVLDGCIFRNVLGTGSYSGAVQIRQGVATVEGCLFDDCRLPVGRSNYGGAIYVGGVGCELELADTTITNCYANTYGGGVYAYNNSQVRLRGNLKVQGNGSGGYAADNLHLRKNAKLQIVGELFGTRQVGVRVYGALAEGAVFATIDVVLTQEGVQHTLAALANDADGELEAVDPDVDLGERIAWGAEEVDKRVPTAAKAVVELSGTGANDGWYATLEDAFAAIAVDGAQLTLLKAATLGDTIAVTNRVSLKSGGSPALAITRVAGCSVLVGKTGQLTLGEVEFRGAEPGAVSPTGAFFYVDGGRLTLQAGAVLSSAYGETVRSESVVLAVDGAEFTMEAGSRLENGHNQLARPADGTGRGGALLADHSTIWLRGGTITGSSAYCYGGGAYIGNWSHLYIAGEVTINGNSDIDGQDSNLTMSENSELVLDGALTGRIGYRRGPGVEREVFGATSMSIWAGDPELTALTNSAANFRNDETRAYGVAVSDGSDRLLLVWSRAIRPDGSFVYDDGTGERTYQVIGDIPPQAIPVSPTPIAFTRIVRDDAAQICTVAFTNMVKGCWYSLYATDSLDDGFEIEGTEPVLRFQATADGEFEHVFTGSEAQRFWRATGEDGEIYP